jgi:hypothetical protein
MEQPRFRSGRLANFFHDPAGLEKECLEKNRILGVGLKVFDEPESETMDILTRLCYRAKGSCFV